MPRLSALILALALAGCQGPAAQPTGSFGLGTPGGRDPANVPKSGSFADLDAARAAAARGPVGGPAIRGRVLGAGADGLGGVEGAIVSASDGRAALTDADGGFAIPGNAPADGGLVAAHPDFVASAVAGLDASSPVDLHLRPRTGRAEGAPPATEKPFVLVGRVRGPAGQPVAGAIVALADARGAFAAPQPTNDDGSFSVMIFAPGRQLQDAALLVGGGAWVGAVTGLTGGAEGMAPVEVTAVAADREVEVAIDAGGFGATPTVDLALEAPNGAKLGLPPDAAGRYHVAVPAGLKLALDVEAIAPETGARSTVRRPDVQLPASGPVRLAEALLPAPGAELDAALVLNEALAWAPVPGATGYTLTLAGLDAAGFIWEGFTATPTMPLSAQARLGSGTYALTLTAWDLPGMDARSLAGLRALRLPRPDRGLRRSTRPVQVTI